MKFKYNKFDKVVDNLINYSISPYEFIDFIRKEKFHAAPYLRKLIVKNASPYIRLCSAWALGDIQDMKSISILKNIYKKEQDVNVRANIVWALFMIDPARIDLSLYKIFLLDKYFVVPLISLKRINGLFWLEGKIDFLEFYNKFDNTLLKLEILRNIRSFRFPKGINKTFKKELYQSNNIYHKMELIKAIGLTNQSNSADILIEYYSKHKHELINNESLAFQYISAMLFLTQSKAHKSLSEIYVHSKSHLIRLKLIETLATVGGPKCLQALKDIYGIESDQKIRNEIQKFINIIPITLR